jgi:16S rRNA (guanine966-N2)-methyltransferase
MALRLIAGTWRGRVLETPAGATTRPSSARVRQALFDMLAHAPWADGGVIDRPVLDVFAGSGALGLEALSRGASRAGFIEQDRTVCAVLQRNIAACRAIERSHLATADAIAPPRAPAPFAVILLDPPYGQNLVPRAIAALHRTGWLTPHALIAAELGRDDPLPDHPLLAERSHGPARLIFYLNPNR